MSANRTHSLSILFEAGNQLSQTLDLDQIYMTMHDLLRQAMDVDEIIIAGYDAATETITCEFYYSWAKEANVNTTPSVPVRLDGSNAQSQVILTGESMLVPNYHLFSHNDTAPFHPQGRTSSGAKKIDTKNLEVRSALVIPMKLKGEVVGVIQIFSYRYNGYSEREYHLAETLTAQMVVARNNAFLYKQAKEELRQRSILQQQLEEERNQLEIRVQERTAELQQALYVRNHFLSNMSHELRTPLTSILGMSELLQYQTHGALNEKQNRFVELIRNNSDHLMHLLNDLLDMSRIATGDMKPYKEWVPMDSIIQACTHYARSRAEDHKVKLFVENHTRIERIYVDPQRTRQALNNILNNAIKFTPKGLAVGFEIMFSEDQKQLEFIIWDQGDGVPPEDLKRMTDPFVVGENAIQENLGGAGLGLALANTMTEMQGGKLNIDSQPGRGTLVTVSLPYDSDRYDSGRGNTMLVTPERADLLREMVTSMKEKKILVADSDERLCELVSSYLEIFEVDITVVHEMKTLAKQLQNEPPDLLILDLKLNGMEDANHFLYRLGKDHRFMRMPILATCAIHRMPDTEEIPLLAVNDLLRKPYSFTDLGTKIRKYLAR